jgi:DNA-binding transcriptional LysR family regulator
VTGTQPPPPFRLAYVPGVTPAKWVRIWDERLPDVSLTLIATPAAEAPTLLRGGGADAALLRLPVEGTDLSAIPLYAETTVVVLPKDHELTVLEEVSAEDLADSLVLHPLDDTLDDMAAGEHPPGLPAKERPATTADAIELVAAGVGLLVLPQSLARLHHRKDLTYRPMPEAAQSRVALSWPQNATTDLVEEFIGIVRGRTVNSSRGRAPTPPQPKKDKRPDPSGTRRKPAAGTSGTSARNTSGAPKRAKGGRPRRRP